MAFEIIKLTLLTFLLITPSVNNLFVKVFSKVNRSKNRSSYRIRFFTVNEPAIPNVLSGYVLAGVCLSVSNFMQKPLIRSSWIAYYQRCSSSSRSSSKNEYYLGGIIALLVYLWTRKNLPYILANKPTIFSWILTIKLWGSAYMRVIAQQPELAQHGPRHGPLVGTYRLPRVRQDHTQTAAAVSAYECGGLHCGRWTHSRTSACMRGASACGAVIGVCAGPVGWQCTNPGHSFVADCRYQLIAGH